MKIQHHEKGVGVLISIVKVTHDAGHQKKCAGISVAFNHDNQKRVERFHLTTFEDGTFTAFVFEPHVVIEHIRYYLQRLDFDAASRLHDCYKFQLQQLSFDYESASRPYLTLRNLLSSYRFAEADAFVAEHGLVRAEPYLRTKADYLMGYFRLKRGLPIDNYKSLALAQVRGNTLVTARAGSGKTLLLTCLTSF
jgi:hypothetical protein